MSPTLPGTRARLGRKDLCREVRSRAHDEPVAIAHGVEATATAVLRVDELRVSAGRAKDAGGAVLAPKVKGFAVACHRASPALRGDELAFVVELTVGCAHYRGIGYLDRSLYRPKVLFGSVVGRRAFGRE